MKCVFTRIELGNLKLHRNGKIAFLFGYFCVLRLIFVLKCNPSSLLLVFLFSSDFNNSFFIHSLLPNVLGDHQLTDICLSKRGKKHSIILQGGEGSLRRTMDD